MIQRIVRLFHPRDRVFFALFRQIADNLEFMGAEVCQSFREKDKQKKEHIFEGITDWEVKTDSLTHRVFVELSKNFITPFDREDVHRLASKLDDVADGINGCTKRIHLYGIDTHDEEPMCQFSVLVLEATKEVRKMIYQLEELRQTKGLYDSIIHINSIENQADELFGENIQRLFEQEQNIKTMIKKKEIYHILEATIDKCEDVANVVESILLKYA